MTTKKKLSRTKQPDTGALAGTPTAVGTASEHPAIAPVKKPEVEAAREIAESAAGGQSKTVGELIKPVATANTVRGGAAFYIPPQKPSGFGVK